MLLERAPVMAPAKVDAVKTEESDVKMMPVVSMVMSEAPKVNVETSEAPVVEKSKTVDNVQTIEEPKKDTPTTDSEVASSYYRSKYYRYYVGF